MNRNGLLAGVSLILTACSSDPVQQPTPPPATIVELQIEAAANVNADSYGNAAPVMLRIYELREISNFNSADFFALFDDEQATLASDLVHKQEFLLKPGSSRKLILKPDENVHNLGFLAAFRQLDTAQWRRNVDIVAHTSQSYKVTLKDTRLTVESVTTGKDTSGASPD
jgi:type VI secretion system protein VasD